MSLPVSESIGERVNKVGEGMIFSGGKNEGK